MFKIAEPLTVQKQHVCPFDRKGNYKCHPLSFPTAEASPGPIPEFGFNPPILSNACCRLDVTCYCSSSIVDVLTRLEAVYSFKEVAR